MRISPLAEMTLWYDRLGKLSQRGNESPATKRFSARTPRRRIFVENRTSLRD